MENGFRFRSFFFSILILWSRFFVIGAGIFYKHEIGERLGLGRSFFSLSSAQLNKKRAAKIPRRVRLAFNAAAYTRASVCNNRGVD